EILAAFDGGARRTLDSRHRVRTSRRNGERHQRLAELRETVSGHSMPRRRRSAKVRGDCREILITQLEVHQGKRRATVRADAKAQYPRKFGIRPPSDACRWIRRE